MGWGLRLLVLEPPDINGCFWQDGINFTIISRSLLRVNYYCLLLLYHCAESSQSVPHNADPSNNTFTVELARYPKVLSALQDLENDYSNLMTDTRKELSNCDREEIKFYLDNLFGIEEFQKCDTIDEVLRKLSRDHIDTFSIGYLKRLIIRFHKDDAIVKSVKEYEEKKEEFLQAEAVEEFRQAVTKLEARAKEKTIVSLTLPKHCTIRTRRDVEELASTPDNQHHKYHTRIIVTPGSIVCVWYVPEALCDDLEQLVKDNIAVFRDDRVEEVSLVGKKSVTISVHEQVKTCMHWNQAYVCAIATKWYVCIPAGQN